MIAIVGGPPASQLQWPSRVATGVALDAHRRWIALIHKTKAIAGWFDDSLANAMLLQLHFVGTNRLQDGIAVDQSPLFRVSHLHRGHRKPPDIPQISVGFVEHGHCIFGKQIAVNAC